MARFGEDYFLEVARGTTTQRYVFKYGYNGDVGTSFETVWTQGGLYSYPAAATVMTVSSGSANDAAAGTGARTVAVVGLDSNWYERTEVVTLNGQTAVSTTTSFLRVFRCYCVTAGSGGVNAGVIYVGTSTVTAGVPANIYTSIAAGEGQTLQSFYTVPGDYDCYAYDYHVICGRTATADLDVRARFRVDNGPWRTGQYFPLYQSGFTVSRRIPQYFPPKTDIEFLAKSSTGSLSVSVSFELLLVHA